MKKIADVINRNLVTIKEDTGLDEIIKIMKEKKIGKLPVLSEKGEVLGVVTRDDLLVKEENAPQPLTIAFWEFLITLPKDASFEEKVRKLSSDKAKDLMSKNYVLAELDSNLSDIITKILEENYDYALVFESKELIGIVTKSDLIEKCF